MMAVLTALMTSGLAGCTAYIAVDQSRPYIIWINFVLALMALAAVLVFAPQSQVLDGRPALPFLMLTYSWLGFLLMGLSGLCARLLVPLSNRQTAVFGSTALGFLLPFLVIYTRSISAMMFYIFVIAILLALRARDRKGA
ncbi:MAG: hypothetical protein AAF700_08845 [Pseudomonadota bacterium]